LSKTFDNGMICASEQSAVILDSVYDKCRAEFVKRGMCILQGEDKEKLRGFMLENGHVNTQIIGQTAMTIASRIGVTVPKGTVVLGAEISEVGPQEPLSYEKLSPILTLYRAKDFEEALDLTKRIVSFGGLGHTSAIYTHTQERLDAFARTVPAFHLFANMPTSFGAIGTSYNFHVDPSLTLGVGSIGGSSISGSLTPFHLLDIKTVAEKQEHMEWYMNPPAIYFNRNCMEEALNDLATAKGGKGERLHRALIVTDTKMVEMGFVARLQTALEQRGFICSVFDAVAPDPDMHCIREGVSACQSFKPDTMVCLGGGSPMDAGKFIRVLYEHPDLHIDDLSARFVELRLRTNEFPEAGDMIHKLVCIPTTSGTASEVTPFSVVTDDEGHKQPIFSYRMTPDMAIIDSSFTDHLPKTLVAHAGLDAITHAIETYTAVDANDFTMPHALRSLSLLFGNLEKSYKVGDKVSRERVHHGASIAGLAFSNSYLGVCHSLSHKVGAVFHLPHGLVNAILLPYVMEYNAVPNPTRMGVYPSYGRPQTLERYAKIARTVHCHGTTDQELATALVKKMQDLSRNLDVPVSFQALGLDEKKFMSKLRNIAEDSFDDQCTPANPRFPLVTELEEVLKNAFYGTEITF
jgi:acetaldehyde dehydrogenase / alcohol dehydrogenase